MDIRPIPFAATYPLRHQVLWPDKPVEYCHLPDDPTGQHFGAFQGEELVAVISLFVPGPLAQFRKFATRPDCQGRGLGTALLRHVLAEAARLGAQRIWCSARLATLPFYERFGLGPDGPAYEKEGIPYVRLQKELP
ncbi:GNAT family N-acetyltransferase [Hymenobacter nivis]|uniref:GNAT family N-acetyltransferase n=1 Tax=Hymenobacter nivis TaxID=1850093 RepID=A0A502GZP5_9BACT|nr:GNAT family N-acetyltransferase [Hymenobacter nivis]TPG66513.1 GNAT family N-acetyltransferase [Hymenobacter nivis]